MQLRKTFLFLALQNTIFGSIVNDIHTSGLFLRLMASFHVRVHPASSLGVFPPYHPQVLGVPFASRHEWNSQCLVALKVPKYSRQRVQYVAQDG